jgi:hypothetical protein
MQKFSRIIAVGAVLFAATVLLWQNGRDWQSISNTDTQLPRIPEESELTRPQTIAQSIASFGEKTLPIVEALDRGQVISLTIGDNNSPRHFLLRQRKVTADNFAISIGADAKFRSMTRSYDGRSFGDGLAHARISLSVVNNSLAALVTESDGTTIQIRTDAISGELQTLTVTPNDHQCQDPKAGESAYAMEGPAFSEADWERGPRAKFEPAAVGGDDPVSGELTRTAEITPWGPQYDNSLADVMLLIVLDKEAAGDTGTANIESKTSQYLALHTNVASIYEHQLGLRLLLQEFIMIPNTGAYTNVSTGSVSAGTSLDAFEIWTAANRPRATYGWTVSALWDEFSSGSTVGLANVSSAGSVHGVCTNKIGKSWAVAGHELGHCFGATHTVGADGIMMASLSTSGTNTRNFFSIEQDTGDVGAISIYNESRTDVLGTTTMRHPLEMPFANDDSATTAINTPVVISPLANDDLATITGGSNSTLTFIETGGVLPVGAGTIAVAGSDITFTPATGFEGTAWFSYTIQGDLGNNGSGWLHKADIGVEVGTTSAPEYNLTVAPGTAYRMRFPPGNGPVTINSNISKGNIFASLFYLDNTFYTINANSNASGTDSFTYTKGGTSYTANITYATTASWDIEIEAGGVKYLYLPPDRRAVDSLTQPAEGNIDPTLENDVVTVSGEGDFYFNQHYLLRADANATGSDTFTYTKGGVTYTVNVTYVDSPVVATDDFVAAYDSATGAYRFNPIMNDQGPGAVSATSIQTKLGPAVGAGISTIANGRYLVSATNLSPTKGTLEFETRPITVAGVSTDVISGFLNFIPAAGATGIAEVEYVVKDAAGNTSTGTVKIALGVIQITSPTGNNVVTPNSGVLLQGQINNPPAPFAPIDSAQWSYSSNDGTVTFADETSLETAITFSAPGSYTLRLTGTAVDYVTAAETSILVSTQSIPDAGLLALIEFDETSGLTAADITGNGNSAALRGTSPTWEPAGGQIGGAVNFNASGEFARINSFAAYNSTILDSYAVAIWFKATSIASGVSMIYEAGGTTSGHSIYILDGKLVTGSWVTSPSSDWEFFEGPTVTDNVWHHVALSVDNGTMTTWYDGQITSTGYALPFNVDTNGNGIAAVNGTSLYDGDLTTPLTVSTISGSGGPLQLTGSIDRLAIYNRALSTFDVTALYENNLNPAPNITLASNSTVPTTSDLATLTGSVTDDDPFTTLWVKITEDGGAIIESPTLNITDILFNRDQPYEIAFSADDGQIRVFKIQTVTVLEASPNSFNTWLSGFIPEGEEEVTPDIDGDRLPNLVEYAIDADPTIPSAPNAPFVSSIIDNGQTFLELKYRRRRDTGVDESIGQTALGRTYHGATTKVELTSDLENWETSYDVFTVIGSPTDNGDGTETITVRTVEPLETAPRQFMKLSASEF